MQRFLGIKPDLSGGWLFVGFKGDSRDGLYFAVSKDGSRWETINFDRPVLWQEQSGELMRDPFIQRAPDGSFRLVWTWSTDPAIIGYSTSTNLIYWSKQLELPVTQVLPAATSVCAPATYYDPEKKNWLLLFSAADSPTRAAGDRTYVSTSPDFKHFQPARPFDPGQDVASATLLAQKQHASGSAAKITPPAGLQPGSLLHLETSEYDLLHNYHGGFDSAQTK
jgi:sucrose-6-phosphate hydrolase SacC (GH32 family)